MLCEAAGKSVPSACFNPCVIRSHVCMCVCVDDSTGPVLAFTLVLYRTAQRLGLNFLPLYSWCDLLPKSLDMASEKGRDSWQRVILMCERVCSCLIGWASGRR